MEKYGHQPLVNGCLVSIKLVLCPDVLDYCKMGNVAHRYVTAVKKDSGITVGHSFLMFTISGGTLTTTVSGQQRYTKSCS